MIKFEYASLAMAKSFSAAVKSVCKEGRFLSNNTGFPVEESVDFVEDIVKNNYSQFYAIEDGKVVGWCDIIPRSELFHRHVGILGMGIIKEFRGQGIGAKLLKKTIAHARKTGIEKIELEVYESNTVAQNLYRKFGFEVEGLKKKSKKHGNKYENTLLMGLI